MIAINQGWGGLQEQQKQTKEVVDKFNHALKRHPIIKGFIGNGKFLSDKITWFENFLEFTADLLTKAESNNLIFKDRSPLDVINTLNEIIELNAELDILYRNNYIRIVSFLNFNSKKLKNILNLNEQIINNLYAIIRIVKRANRTSNHETSEMAKSAAMRSANTIKTIYGKH